MVVRNQDLHPFKLVAEHCFRRDLFFQSHNDATWVIEKLICIIYVCNWLCDWVFDLKIVCWKYAKFFCILYPARLLQWYSLGRFGLKFRLQIYFLNRSNSWPVIKITASDDWGHYTVLWLRRWCVHRRDKNPTTSISHHKKQWSLPPSKTSSLVKLLTRNFRSKNWKMSMDPWEFWHLLSVLLLLVTPLARFLAKRLD